MTDALTAKTVKAVENAYRDMNIAFANEGVFICVNIGVNAFEDRKLVNTLPNDPTKPETNPISTCFSRAAVLGGTAFQRIHGC